MPIGFFNLTPRPFGLFVRMRIALINPSTTNDITYHNIAIAARPATCVIDRLAHPQLKAVAQHGRGLVALELGGSLAVHLELRHPDRIGSDRVAAHDGVMVAVFGDASQARRVSVRAHCPAAQSCRAAIMETVMRYGALDEAALHG